MAVPSFVGGEHSLTVDLQTLQEGEGKAAFLRSVVSHLRDISGDHWWCKAPCVAAELLPCTSGISVTSENFRKIIGDQLTVCPACAKGFYGVLYVWQSTTAMSETDISIVLHGVREWSAKRIISLLDGAVEELVAVKARVMREAGMHGALEVARKKCEDAFFEALMDARLVMREDVAKSIGSMFSKLDRCPMKSESAVDRDGMCSPGVFVLCFHSSFVVRDWASTCLKKHLFAKDEIGVSHLDLSLPPSVEELLRRCVERVENGTDSSILDLTSDADLEAEVMFHCTLEVVWSGISPILLAFKSPELLTAVLQKNPGFFPHLVTNLECESRHFAVANSARILAHILKLLGFRLWLGQSDVEPSTVFENAKEAFENPLANDEVKATLFELFPPLVRSLVGMKPAETVKSLASCLELLFEASDLSPGSKKRDTIRFFFQAKMASTSSPGRARLSAATVLLECYQQFPHVVSSLDSSKVAQLLELMLSGDGVQLVPGKLLRTILIHDASNIVRAVTGPAVASMAIQKRPVCVDLDTLSASKASGHHTSLAVQDDGTSDSDSDDDVTFVSSSASQFASTDYSPFRGDGEFLWSQPVWTCLLKKQFRVRSLSVPKREYPECDALLDVHALLGMLDIPACELSLEQVKLLLDKTVGIVYMDDVNEKVRDLERATLDVAFVTCVQAVSAQIELAHDQMTAKRPLESWTSKLPQCAGHLLASSQKEIRERSFGLLQFISKPRNLSASLNHGSADRCIAIRSILSVGVRGLSVLDGTGEAVALMSVFGPQYSFRCYMHMMSWVNSLLSSAGDAVEIFLHAGGQDQITGLVEQFAVTWKGQLEEKRKHFGEVTARFLSVLSDVWKFLILAEDGDIDAEKHMELLDLVFLFADCEMVIVQAKWASLVASVARRFKFNGKHKIHVEKLLESSPDNPARFRLADCTKLSEAFGLSCVSHPCPIQKSIPNLESKGSSKRKIPIPNSSSYRQTSWPDVDVELVASKNIPFCPSPQNFNIAQNGQGRASEELRLGLLRERVTADSTRRKKVKTRLRYKFDPNPKGGRSTASQRQLPKKGPPPAGHKTKMEIRQEKAAEEANKKRESRAAEPSTGLIQLAPTKTTRKHERVVIKCPDPLPTKMREGRHRENVTSVRKSLKKRTLDMFHGGLVGQKVSSILNDRELSSPKFPPPPGDFSSSEKYVQYWEGLVFQELLAQIRQALDTEAIVARNSPVDDEKGWSCRTPFEVAVPPSHDKSNCFKKVVVRYCGEVFLRNSNPSVENRTGKWVDDYSAAKLLPGDLLRVQMVTHGRGHTRGSHDSEDFVLLLGVVDSVTFQGRDVLVTLKMKFPPSVTEPGPERAMRLSKLFAMTSSHRQLQALWRVNKLPETVLHALIYPKSYWKERQRLIGVKRSGDRSEAMNISASRAAVVQELRLSGLNVSQIDFIEDSLRLISAPPSQVAGQGFTLLQGPPGTGKTNTTVSLLSVLLADSLCGRAEVAHKRNVKHTQQVKRKMLNVGGARIEVPVASNRVLVCAPSNAAVDELLVRVLRNGLLTPSGDRATPRVVRVGSGSKDDDVLSVTLDSILDRGGAGSGVQKGGSRRRARNGEDQDAYLERQALRTSVQKASAAVGVAHNARKDAQNAFITTISEESGLSAKERTEKEAAFEKQYKSLSLSLHQAHEKKKQISKLLTQADQKGRLADQRAELDFVERKACIINSASIVFSTLNAAAHDVLGLSCAPFDAVVIDEAAQSVEPDILIPLVGVTVGDRKAANVVSRCFMVGDPKQLPATVLSNNGDIVKGLGRSLFERLQDAKYSRVHLLGTQYRMHPLIASFPSSHFYDSRLRNGPCVKSVDMWKPYHFDKKVRFGPLTFLDTSRAPGVSERKSGGGSIANRGEAKIVCSLLAALFKQYPSELLEQGEVAVLTPYKQQVSVIRQEINNVRSLSRSEIEVSTVDGIQGREKAIVIVSTVRGGRSGHGIGFVNDVQRMNVALTRAKLSLVVVGDAQRLASHSSDWSAFIQHCSAKSRILQVKSTQELFPESFARNGRERLPAPGKLPSLDALPALDLDESRIGHERIEAAELSDSDDDDAHVPVLVKERTVLNEREGRGASKLGLDAVEYSKPTRIVDASASVPGRRRRAERKSVSSVPERSGASYTVLKTKQKGTDGEIDNEELPTSKARTKATANTAAIPLSCLVTKPIRFTDKPPTFTSRATCAPPSARPISISRRGSEGAAAENGSGSVLGKRPEPSSSNRVSHALKTSGASKRPRVADVRSNQKAQKAQQAQQAQQRLISHNLAKASRGNVGHSSVEAERLQNIRHRNSQGRGGTNAPGRTASSAQQHSGFSRQIEQGSNNRRQLSANIASSRVVNPGKVGADLQKSGFTSRPSSSAGAPQLSYAVRRSGEAGHSGSALTAGPKRARSSTGNQSKSAPKPPKKFSLMAVAAAAAKTSIARNGVTLSSASSNGPEQNSEKR